MKGQFHRFLVKGRNPCRTVHIFIFQKPGVRCAVGVNQAIHTEIAVMNLFFKIAPVEQLCLSVCGLPGIYPVIAPLPHKTAAHLIPAVYKLKIIFKIAGAIAHRMTVFHKKKRLTPVFFKIFSDFFQLWIHPAV